MSTRLRTVLMWLLLAALPLQGWAAATMSVCGASHRQQAMHMHHAHDHAAHAGDHDATPHHAVHQPAADAQAHDLGKFTCSACALCCTAAAPPASTLSLDDVSPAGLAPQGVTAAATAFITGGPERPPRSSLA